MGQSYIVATGETSGHNNPVRLDVLPISVHLFSHVSTLMYLCGVRISVTMQAAGIRDTDYPALSVLCRTPVCLLDGVCPSVCLSFRSLCGEVRIFLILFFSSFRFIVWMAHK
jgi:hypothetical protein